MSYVETFTALITVAAIGSGCAGTGGLDTIRTKKPCKTLIRSIHDTNSLSEDWLVSLPVGALAGVVRVE